MPYQHSFTVKTGYLAKFPSFFQLRLGRVVLFSPLQALFAVDFKGRCCREV
jgi:hypothetical protein